jgi:AAA domain, putative AbiEii toxin, Type IV TA system
VELSSYRVRNFRSINDSGPITVGRTTTLVGRNESGKSNLLLALYSLNPPAGIQPLVPIKDFPRHQALTDCDDQTPVLQTTWMLTPEESAALRALWPRAQSVRQVHISRDYRGLRQVDFVGLPDLPFSVTRAQQLWSQVVIGVDSMSQATPEPQRATLLGARRIIETSLQSQAGRGAIALAVKTAGDQLHAAIVAAGWELPSAQEEALAELCDIAEWTASEEPVRAQAVEWTLKRLPTFVYLDEYPQFEGHQDIAAYLARKAQGKITAADRNFEKVCKVTGIVPSLFQELYTKGDHATRNQLANRAGAILTRELRRLWKDRALKVRFSADGQHLDTLISDPNAAYDVEVNLDERSRGFRWFYSFFVTFAADTKDGGTGGAILLLDEPGLYLHSASQTDLVGYLRSELPNQILYTTHSPFMVPVADLESVRTVTIDGEAGTTVSDSPQGDEKTLFPLRAALGLSLGRSLFSAPDNLVVEAITDYWYLSAASEYLRSLGLPGLPAGLAITPAGGAQKISHLVALLASEPRNGLVLLGGEAQVEWTDGGLARSALIRDDQVVFVGAAFGGVDSRAADLEDLLDSEVYWDLVRTAYTRELAGTGLTLNDTIARIVPRYEAAFSQRGIAFEKSRPAREFLARVALSPSSVITPTAQGRFSRLFAAIGGVRSKPPGAAR